MYLLTIIGLLVNPVAGVGGKLAWKGTDNIERAWHVIDEGEEQPVLHIIQRIQPYLPDADWLLTSITPNFDGQVVYQMPAHSSAVHTKEAVAEFIAHGAELILFIGGDGTARDVAEVVKDKLPIIGIPGGVKIFSGCFLHTPEDISTVGQWDGNIEEVELLDLDEEAYKQGHTIPKLFGVVKVPKITAVQVGKSGFGATEDNRTFELFAERIQKENWLSGTIIVGPGSTMYNITKNLQLEKTLLGIDVYENGKLSMQDAQGKDIEPLHIDEIWLTPIGRQGHIIGRGNKQLTPKVLAKLSLKQLRIFATPEKLLHTPELFVDTGDAELDKKYRGYVKVYTGFHDASVRKVS